MGIWNTDIEVECESQKKDGQLLCTAKKGEKTAKILANMNKSGKLTIIKHRGSKSLLDELWVDMQERAEPSSREPNQAEGDDF